DEGGEARTTGAWLDVVRDAGRTTRGVLVGQPRNRPTSGVRRVERPDASNGARVADSRLGGGQEGSRASAARTERWHARVRMGSEVAGSLGCVEGYGEW